MAYYALVRFTNLAPLKRAISDRKVVTHKAILPGTISDGIKTDAVATKHNSMLGM